MRPEYGPEAAERLDRKNLGDFNRRPARRVRAHSQQIAHVRSAMGAQRAHGGGGAADGAMVPRAAAYRDARGGAAPARQDPAAAARRTRRAAGLRVALRASGQ